MLVVLGLTILSAILAGALSAATARYYVFAKISSSILLGISGVGAVTAGLTGIITAKIFDYQISSPLGSAALPDLHLVLDPLSGFFLALVGLVVIGIAVYGNNNLRSFGCVFTGLFVAGMYVVLLAQDVFTFMLAWESMSIASYFLVAYQHEQAVNRSAALVYLLMSQISGLLILAAFSILLKFPQQITPVWASIVFLLALFGFGGKAGIVPLHFWLPEAHPVAPSHISALMSAAMLKVAIYGFMRFAFTYLKISYWQWGALVVLIGLISAIVGIIGALMHQDLKKILAYSSIENIGIIFTSLGLALIFNYTGHHALAALGLVAALYHCLNHAAFKSLLFLGAGVVIAQSREHDLNRLGGLIKVMPCTGWCFLIGCMSIAALPPFNGFVSEWLILQDAIASICLTNAVARVMLLAAAAVIILTSALALACFAKVYGVIFLGQQRSPNLASAHDPKLHKLIAMGFLATLCVILGVLPQFILPLLNTITMQLVHAQVVTTNWLWLNAINVKVITSPASILIMVGVLLVIIVGWLLNKKSRANNATMIVKPWDCGYGGLTSAMQYNSSAFSMPFKRIFAQFILSYKIVANHCKFDAAGWRLAKKFARLQGGNVRVYLAYTLVTLILLLVLV